MKDTSTDATLLKADGTRFTPSVVNFIEYDHKGTMGRTQRLASSGGECKTTNRREADNGADITIRGIVQESEVDDLRQLKSEPNLALITDVHSEKNVIVKRLTLEQSSDLVDVTKQGRTELAFRFKLTLKTP